MTRLEVMYDQRAVLSNSEPCPPRVPWRGLLCVSAIACAENRALCFTVRVASAYIHLWINASFYFKMLSEKWVLCSVLLSDFPPALVLLCCSLHRGFLGFRDGKGQAMAPLLGTQLQPVAKRSLQKGGDLSPAASPGLCTMPCPPNASEENLFGSFCLAHPIYWN